MVLNAACQIFSTFLVSPILRFTTWVFQLSEDKRNNSKEKGALSPMQKYLLYETFKRNISKSPSLQYTFVSTFKFYYYLFRRIIWVIRINQPVFICSKSTMETKEKCVKSVQSQQWKQKKNEWNLFKVNNGNKRKMCEICSKLTIKTPKRLNLRRSLPILITLNIIHSLFCFHYWL